MQAVNQEIDEHRRLVESTLRQATPSSPHPSLQRLAERYRVELSVSPTPELTELYTRAEVVPLSLALAQAAHESAWGTSRFAVEGRNYFGIWCYQPGCGITPLERTPGATHEVQRFESVTDSVRRYAHLLNTHPAYKELRLIRAAARASGRTPRGADIAIGLSSYSERGPDYVAEIRQIIRVNRLED